MSMNASMNGLDVTIRCAPGFTWVRLVVDPKSWQRGTWWSVRGIAKVRALGPLRLVTMREDCIERAYAAGIFTRDADR